MPSKTLLYCWVAQGFSVLVPKRRGEGFVKTPYGHHNSPELNEIADVADCDIFGLDGSLDFQVKELYFGTPEAQETFETKVLPWLEKHYGMSSREVGTSEFWRLHPFTKEA